jgi:hypothetical protein
MIIHIIKLIFININILSLLFILGKYSFYKKSKEGGGL